jgi:uncharacterized protein (TIGR02145 family)
MKKSAMVFMAFACVLANVFISCKKDNDDPIVDPPPTTPTFTDSRDGKVYKMITIGTQTWMAENLNYQGSLLPAASDTCYANSASNCSTYGTLYTHAGALAAVPAGWHLPSDEEWKTLEKYLGMTQTEADKTAEWRGSDEGSKVREGGSSGLNLKFGGALYTNNVPSVFDGLTEVARYWTSTIKTDPEYYERSIATLTPNETKIYRGGRNKNMMLSVRCIKDYL